MPGIKSDFNGDGHAEIPVASPWGVGILQLAGNTLDALAMAPNGTRFGGWLLNTKDNLFNLTADFNGDGQAEVLVVSPWGIGILKLAGNTLDAPMMAPNGTRFGGWLLNTLDNRLDPVADFDGDGRTEILSTSPWGLGVLKLAGNTLSSPVMAPSGTRFGGWLLNTVDNRFSQVGDLDGDGRAEILVTSPWGIGILKLSGDTLTVEMMASNGTRFGGWLLNTADNHVDYVADFDGDGRAEILVTSPWGIGVLKLAGNTLDAPMMAPNGTRFGGWLLNTADNHVGMGEKCVRLHVKILTNPNQSIDSMVASMQRVYERVGVRVHHVSTENLNLPTLIDLDVGNCAGSFTAEQTQLFANRNGVGFNDVVVYFVRSTVPPYNGCASHPNGQPGAAVAQAATVWTMPHETGHVLGLVHVNDNTRLMTGNGTGNLTKIPPDLIAEEVNTMRASGSTYRT
jgi:hypothetical protein